jgi:hypothetical protein
MTTRNALFYEMVDRLLIFPILLLLIGVVVSDSMSRVISMGAGGFLAVLVFLYIWR